MPDNDTLTELEAALIGAPDADRDLTQLVADVRAERPEPDPQFLARLEAQVQGGFRSPPSTSGRPAAAAAPRPWWRRRLVVAGGLMSAVLALIVGVAVLNGGGGTGDGSIAGYSAAPSAPSSSDSAVPSTGSGTSGAAPERSEAAPAPTVTTPPTAPESETLKGPRRVERAASLTLVAKRGQLQTTADRVIGLAGRVGGYVASSSVSTQGRGGQAEIRLRVPTDRLDETLRAIGRLGSIRSLDQQSRDVTSSYDAAATEAEEARAERTSLLASMAKAGSAGERRRVRGRLIENRARLQRAESNLAAQRSRAGRATIDVSVVTAAPGAAAAASDDDGSWGVTAAARSILSVLSVSAGVLLLVLAAVVPLAALTAIGLLAVRAMRRGRRERALDAESRP